MAYQPIENYGIIGNMRTIALVGMDGSIDWYCYPHFDSPSIFGAILDDKKGGRFRIQPTSENASKKQLYWPDTNILVTRFLDEEGIGEIEDFMPVGLPPDSPWYHQLLRRVKCVRGSIRFAVECDPAFDYGRASHETTVDSNGATFKNSSLSMQLATDVPLEKNSSNGVQGNFTLKEGESKIFIFKDKDPNQAENFLTEVKEAEMLFKITVNYWQHWLSSCTYRGRWRHQVYRSALALKLMTFEPSGAIIASPTTSLPEVIGGERNWDYRFTWMRDAAFTVYGLLRIGFKEEAAGFMRWIHDHQKDISPNQPAPVLMRITGEKTLEEESLDHWDGYRGSKPVRIGNAATHQFQNDIYGELFDSLYLFNKHVQPIGYDVWVKLRARLDWICEAWKLPDDGIWEVRAERQHFVFSKVMNWVALDRGIRLAQKRSLPGDIEKWTHARDEIYEEVMNRGWNKEIGAFTQTYDSDRLDASLLILPLVFFIAPNDSRMVSTIRKIAKSPVDGGLTSDGLVYRYIPDSAVDGLCGKEGTFNMCSFWLVEAMTRAGKVDKPFLEEGRLLFEKMLGYGNHLGLYSEQTGNQGKALGNFPQAFTHLALISAAFNLDRTLDDHA